MRGNDRINACLPDELIVEVFRLLDSKPSRDACSLVCKRWLSLERLSRTTLRICATGSPDFVVDLLARRFRNVRTVHIDERLSISFPTPPGRRRATDIAAVSSVRLHSANGSDDGVLDSNSLSDAGMTAIGDGFPKLEKLSLIWCSSVSSIGLTSLADKCKLLKSLDLQGCYVGDQGLAAVGKCCKQLEDLNLRFCEGLTDVCLVELALGVGNSLKSLGIAACAKITDAAMEAVGVHCKSLENLSLDAEFIHNKGVVSVAQGCPALKSLKLQCINVTDEALTAVGTSCLSPEVLTLYSFQKFTDKGLRAIGKGCKKLKNLIVSDCFFLGDNALESIATGCKELTHLEVNGCHNIGTLGLESIGKSCPRLTELALLYCQRIGNFALSEVGRGCRFLQSLRLEDCSSIGDEDICNIAKGCINLKKLHISRCFEIGNKGVVAVGDYCRSLTDLSLQFCYRVGDQALIAVAQCSSLQYLNVSGCHQIGDAGLIAIARSCPQISYLDVSILQNLGDMAMAELGEGCPNLKDIVLSHCRQVTDVGINHLVKNCTMLTSCHMVYCPGITSDGVATVVSSCPYIKKVLVEKCKLLREAMTGGCSIRAIWILNSLDAVVFSRRFPVVEKRWRGVCKSENEISAEGGLNSSVFPLLPSDSELAAAFVDRKRREGSLRGFGVRVSQSAEGSDSWVDDPITRHIIGIYISNEEGGDDNLLWPLILHTKGHYCILVLPMVEPRHLKAFVKLCNRSDCGNAVGVEDSISTILLDLPSITGAFMVAHAIGDIIIGDVAEPEVVVSASPSVGGLLDSLTGSIGISSISSRAKPVAAPVASSTPSGIAATGTVTSDALKTGSRPLDKDALRTFISSSMPFGTPLDLSFPNILSIRVNGFSSSDLPPADLKQPAWKPYLYKGRQRILFSVHETVQAALYDRDEIPDSISISGQINCRAELEGLPDVTFPLIGLNADHIEVLSFHPCVQVPEQGADKQAVIFSPPLGNFVLMRYQAVCGLGPPIKGFYQLSMVSEDKGDFLFKLRLMDGYKSPLAMEFCTVTMPFPTRRVVSFDGTPSVGMVSTTDHSVEWKIVTGGRGLTKSIEATFPGKVQFAPWKPQKSPTSSSAFGSIADEDSDIETDGNNNNMVNVDEFLTEKMSKDLHPADLEEPFCWHAYNYAKVSFKIVGASLSGMSSDPKSVSIYPTVKAPVEFSTQVTSGDYILWNTLGRCPSVAVAKV
ncbi:hypothetical protein ACFX2I_021915 [Malus domestica]